MCLHVCDAPNCHNVFECATRCLVDPNLPVLCSSCENDQFTVGECYDCREITVLPPRVFYFDREERLRGVLTAVVGDKCDSCQEHLPRSA